MRCRLRHRGHRKMEAVPNSRNYRVVCRKCGRVIRIVRSDRWRLA